MEEKAIKFLKALKPTDGVVIIFNNDDDGMCSCAIVKKYLLSIGVDPYIISQPMPPDKNLLRRVQTGAPNRIILLDMAIDEMPQLVGKMKSFADVLIVDHHVIRNNLNSASVVHYNPRLKSPKIYQSTTYLAYKMVSKIMDISDMLWVAATGAVADYDLRWSEDVMKEAQKVWDMKTFQRLAAMLDSARLTHSKSCEQIVDVVLNSKSPEQILQSKDFLQSYNDIESEINAVVSDAFANAEKSGEIVFYNIKAKYNIKSVISTKLSEKWPDKLVIIWEKTGNRISMSVRNQNKNIDANKVIRAAVKGIKGASGGGHEAAAGGTMPAESWEEFKRNLMEAVEKRQK
jgi:single-stranded DNA-specific DHH superfamily exonuclease